MSINDGFVDDIPGGQKTMAYNGYADTHITEGEQKVYVRSNTFYTPESLFGGDPFSTWMITLDELLTSKVFVENNFCGGIAASLRVWEESNSSTPHKHRNNFAQEGGNEYGNSHSSGDLYYPAGVTLSDLFDFDTCSMTGGLRTAATDGGTLGVRWNPIPTRSQIAQIMANDDVNWTDTYPAASIPETSDGDEVWTSAFFNEDLRSASF